MALQHVTSARLENLYKQLLGMLIKLSAHASLIIYMAHYRDQGCHSVSINKRFIFREPCS